ncbi:uncharacterized protein HD556DRAFT_1440304 [Suillus plorans]|uniref:F-box domain-containing protein n=1 Tax=Suillus plorans TaxID=116603 RepID=A0A9P7DMK7_9AGAM|nr:uncharacterized protein HD556DRAFT_1440304 [Suillus plorans]KAG1798599.1 hypothetical protein HD556DRAFT_1440304 [Suillus plorans]
MQTAVLAPNNAPPAAAQYTEAPGLPANTPFNVINRASQLQPVRKGPINTLPKEIILHIFKLGASCGDSQKRIDFAVLVSQVCGTWRDVAFSCSSLWADITITTDNMYNVDGGHAIVNTSLLRAKEFASRSRVFPLSVRLKLLVPPNFVYLQIGTIIIMNWLRLVFPRIKYLSIHCDTLHIARLVTNRLQTVPMENLETYKMKFGTEVLSFCHSIILPPDVRFLFLAGQNEEQTHTADNLDLLPKLTRVSLSGFPVSWSRWSLTRLTSLSINFMTLHDRPSMDVLKYILALNGETLEKLEIQGAIQRFGRIPCNADELPTNLPRLMDLTLGYLSQWEAIIFFLHFEAPALKHLKLCDVSRSILTRHFKDGFDSNSLVIQNIPALQPFNKFSSTILLEHLVYVCSLLEQVETLALEHFSLPPLVSDLFWQDDDPLKHLHEAPVFLAYRMLQKCSRLRRLALIDPEQCFLDALNMYPDDPKTSSPAPVLTHLCLASSDCDRLKLFLERRAESLAKEKGPRILDYLELATAKKDVHVLEDIVSQHVDMSRIAKSSLAAEWHGSGVLCPSKCT